MALFNFFNEPRREAIETGLGAAALVLPVGADFAFAHWAMSFDPTTALSERITGHIVLMGLGVAGVLGAFLLFSVIHAVGELVCAVLAERGWDPRPDRD